MVVTVLHIRMDLILKKKYKDSYGKTKNASASCQIYINFDDKGDGGTERYAISYFLLCLKLDLMTPIVTGGQISLFSMILVIMKKQNTGYRDIKNMTDFKK